jgi:DNA-binding NarL/FixJ family response regulator
MVQKRTVLIVDDHPLFREGLKAIIKKDQRYEVVGEAGTAHEGMELAKKFKPHLALVDLSLPDLSGIDLTRALKKSLPETEVIIVSMHCKINYITEVFNLGAKGYIVKESAAEKLLQGLDDVSKGNYFLDYAVSDRVVRRLIETPSDEGKVSEISYGSLSKREQEVLRLVAEGFSSKEIAEKLFISPKTVENHRGVIMNKLGLHTVAELVRYAARLGLVDVDLWQS